jgi:hypothetical protein
VDDYPYLAMDTEFPGVVARPVGNFKNSGEYHYQTLRQVHVEETCIRDERRSLLLLSGTLHVLVNIQHT